MKIVIFILTVFLCKATYALDCNNDPCETQGYFNSTRGYRCLQLGSDALCTCPGTAYEINMPCRLCNRTNPINNACRNTNKLIACLEYDDCGTSFKCLCQDAATGDAVFTTNADCDTSASLVCSGSVGPGTGPSPCLHGGVFANNVCNCPSGYSGTVCQDKNDHNLCERIICKNNGVCAVQPQNGPYQSVCLCRYGTWGEYCELTGTSGFCSSDSCMNNGACRENVVGSTRFAYCQCQPGYNGTKCDKSYFTCSTAGLFRDDNLHEQGKYFECKLASGILRLQQKSCPKGLYFDSALKLCTLKK
ncbi:hypothetical protein I4U23_008814 [Adineta vaga]|nr:hypothetical protein I4U23_008814 [Adineta vaga]